MQIELCSNNDLGVPSRFVLSVQKNNLKQVFQQASIHISRNITLLCKQILVLCVVNQQDSIVFMQINLTLSKQKNATVQVIFDRFHHNSLHFHSPVIKEGTSHPLGTSKEDGVHSPLMLHLDKVAVYNISISLMTPVIDDK